MRTRIHSEPEDRWRRHLAEALVDDSPRRALAAANALGGPARLPALVAACASWGAGQTARALLKAGWAAEDPASEEPSALRWACARGDVELARELLARGSDPFSCDSKRLCALGACAVAGRIDLLEELLSKHSPSARQGPLDGALAEACVADTPEAGRGCLALEAAGARWTHRSASIEAMSGARNLAELAALRGPLLHVKDSRAFACALEARHPPKKGRGDWTDWRALELSPERLAWAESAVMNARHPSLPVRTGGPRRI